MEQHSQNQVDKKGGNALGCFVAFIAIAFVFICIAVGLSNTKGGNSFARREATNNDVTISSSDSNILSIELVVVPKHDIQDLEITISYYNDDRELVKTMSRSFGDVKEGMQYTQNISISNFSFSELFELSYYRCTVTGGTVSVFG